MRKKIEFFCIIANILFYCSVLLMIYLYVIDDNTCKWLVAILMLLVSVFGVAIPDMMINININGIDIKLVRCSILIKYAIFCIIYTFLDCYYFYALMFSGVLGLLDIIVEYSLIKQIIKTNTYTITFIEKLRQQDTASADKNLKYVVVNMLSVLIVFNIQDIFIKIIAGIIAIVIHMCCCEKIIFNICNANQKQRRVIKIGLCMIQLLAIVCAIGNISIATYTVLGFYYMVVIDLTQKNNTALIKLKNT